MKSLRHLRTPYQRPVDVQTRIAEIRKKRAEKEKIVAKILSKPRR